MAQPVIAAPAPKFPTADEIMASMLADMPALREFEVDLSIASLVIALDLQGKSKEKILAWCTAALDSHPDSARLRDAIGKVMEVTMKRELAFISQIFQRTGVQITTKEGAQAVAFVVTAEVKEQMSAKGTSSGLNTRLQAALDFLHEHIVDLYAKQFAVQTNAPAPEPARVTGLEAALINVLSIFPGALKPEEHVDRSAAAAPIPVWDWKTPVAFDANSEPGKLLIAQLVLIEAEIEDAKDAKKAFEALKAGKFSKERLEQFFLTFKAQLMHQIEQSLGILTVVGKERAELLSEATKIDAIQARLASALERIA